MSSLPPSKNLRAPTAPNGDVVKRAGTEKAIEESMRMWHNMREERDDALDSAASLRTKIIELEATNAVLLSRNQDLERRNEQWLIELTTIRTKIEYLGQLGDSISLATYEILHGPKDNQSANVMGDTLGNLHPSSPQEEVLPREGETLQELARRLVQETDPSAAAQEEKGTPEWLNSNSQSPRPSSSTPTPKISQPATPSTPPLKK
jgi:hypothetical protein